MRKLRDDIRVAECGGLSSNMIHTLYVDIKYGTVSQDYPDSFYEQPHIEEGMFGKGVDCDGEDAWGYLTQLSDNNFTAYPYRVGELWCESFTPGLPDDVDADGMPKP